MSNQILIRYKTIKNEKPDKANMIQIWYHFEIAFRIAGSTAVECCATRLSRGMGLWRLAIRARKLDVLIDEHVEFIARPDLQGRLNI